MHKWITELPGSPATPAASNEIQNSKPSNGPGTEEFPKDARPSQFLHRHGCRGSEKSWHNRLVLGEGCLMKKNSLFFWARRIFDPAKFYPFRSSAAGKNPQRLPGDGGTREVPDQHPYTVLAERAVHRGRLNPEWDSANCRTAAPSL